MPNFVEIAPTAAYNVDMYVSILC